VSTNESTAIPRRTILGWVLGIALTMTLVLVVEWWLGWGSILAVWREVPPQLLLLASGLALLSYGLRSARLALVATGLGAQASSWSWFRITALHLLAINVVPARAGEAALPLLMRRHCAVPLAQGLGLLVAIRLHDLVAMATLGLTALGWLMFGGTIAALVGVGLGLAGWLSLVWAPRLILPLADHGPKWLAVLSWPLRLLPRNLSRVYALTLAAWAAKWTSLAVIAGVVANLDPVRAIIAIGAAEVAALSPIQGVAGAGTFEAAVGGALVFSGLAASEALQAAIQLHLFLLGISVVLAALALLLPHRGPKSSDPP
jgi:uncharacterized membrane protein YbhN (UPF0104 family)